MELPDELLVSANDRPPLAPGEFHLLEVELQLEQQAAGAAASGSSRRILIPFVEAIVPRVELAAGWVGITPPPGLLDL